MCSAWWARHVAFVAIGFFLTLAGPALPVGESSPRPEAVAETRLLMDGLAQANFRGLERLLKQQPQDAEAWVFARGQALLIAETGNLLMLRPPHNQGQSAWYERSADLRATATRLALAAAGRDYQRCRTGLTELANSCNRCHQTFRIRHVVRPFTEPADTDELPPPRRLLDK